MSRAKPAGKRRGPKVDPERLAARVMREPDRLEEIIRGLEAAQGAARFGWAKVLLILARKAPAILYPRLDVVLGLLRGESKILQWTAILAIGDLAAVDSKGRIEAILDELLAPIPGPVMITAANTIGAAAKIARARPRLADRIAREILKVEKARYATPECRNVAIGQAIEALDEFFEAISDREPVIGFIERQLENTRPATRKKAEKWLGRHRRD